MNLINIALWTVSIGLALIGIVFGIVASINSGKANAQVRELIRTTFIVEESQKFLYTNLKSIVNSNKKVVKDITNDTLFSDYSLMAANTRLPLLSRATIDSFMKTEFEHLTASYLEVKETLDMRFLGTIRDIKKLSTDEKIGSELAKDLADYHREVVRIVSKLINSYTQLT